MTEEEKQNKKAAYQLACLVKDSAYCEFCPVSDGCNLNFNRDDVEYYVRFFNWFNNTNEFATDIDVGCKDHDKLTKQDKKSGTGFDGVQREVQGGVTWNRLFHRGLFMQCMF